MSTVTLHVKVYNKSQIRVVDRFLVSSLEGLKVETEIVEVTSRGWVRTNVSGSDRKAALRYLDEKIGLCPPHLNHLDRFSKVKGRITTLERSRRCIYLDVGVVSPTNLEVTIPLKHLQTHLADGRKMALKRLADLFGFHENFPLTIEIYSIDRDNEHVEGMLSEKQLTLYKDWTISLLDRLIVLGASYDEVVLALRQSKCKRDVVDIESLGLFEQTIVCKLGTDAAGLIPKIGRKLRNADLSVLNPKGILQFLGEEINAVAQRAL